MKKKVVFYIFCFIGIAYRFYYQFLKPSFNVDEISLGLNIKSSTYLQLLKPMELGQSAPPLFLWLQKFFIELPIPSWVAFKLISFVISSLSLIVFLRFIKKYKYNIILIIPFIILLFNPYVIYNSLALKQYTFDLFGVLFLLTYFETDEFKKRASIMFLVWSFLSNIAVFACAGFLIYICIDKYYKTLKCVPRQLKLFFQENYILISSLFPYVIYFFWFMSQPGAIELKVYMKKYWEESFMPLDMSFFKYWLYQINGFISYFYSMHRVVAVFIFLLSFGLLFYQWKRRIKIYFKKEIMLCLCIFFVHLALNILEFYPLSDRLYLYLITLFLLILVSSIYFLVLHFRLNKKVISVAFSLSILASYSTYITFKENDVNSVYNFIETKNEKTIYLTKKGKNVIESFNSITDNYFLHNIELLSIDDSLSKSKYIVSRFHKKLRPGIIYQEDGIILKLLNENRIKLSKSLDGYHIYEILK